MLAHVLSLKKMQPPFAVQPKLNGVRCLYQNDIMTSRDEIPWAQTMLTHIREELSTLIPAPWILDGELYVHGWSLQQINSAVAVKRNEPTDRTFLVTYNVFDTVSLQGFLTRFKAITPILRDLKHVKLVPTHLCQSHSEADALYLHYRKLGYEGIMYRKLDQPYEPDKRVHTLLKRKGWLDDEFEIIGVQEGEGRCVGMCGALVCRATNGATFNVGTGFDDSTRVSFLTSPPIGLFAKVQYLSLSDSGIPLNPSFQCLM